MAEIKIIENDRREQFVAAAGQTIFPFDFPIFDADEIAVFRTRAGVDAKLTLDADYTVTGVGEEAGGNVVLTAGAAEGDVITIQGDMPRARTTDFQEGGDFRAVVINRELDRLQVQIQELSRITSRKVGLLDTDTTEVALLPRKADRALRYLAFDADGRPITAEGTGDPTPITPFAATLLDDVDAAAARATLGAAGVDAENVFEKTQRFQQSDDSSSAGPKIIIARLSKSPAINDFLGQIQFIGQDENGEEQIYAMLSPFIANPAAGAHAGALRILIPAAGTLAERLRIGAGVVLGGSIPGGDKGAGTLNAAEFYRNGVPLIKAGTPLVLNPYTVNTTVTQAHGLGVEPSFLRVVLECLSSEGGYSTGDRIIVSAAMDAENTSVPAFRVKANGTNLVLVTHQSGRPNIVHGSSRDNFAITAANWKLEITPYLVG